MHPIKYLWGLRALIYKPFFGKIGSNSYIGKPCFLEGIQNIYIGNRVRIFPGARIQTLDDGVIEIGDNTAIEQNVHITSAKTKLEIGNNVTILGNTFITNLDHNYQDISKSVLEQGISSKITKIGDGCFIGFGSAIQAGTVLGKHCIIGASSVVRGIFPDYVVIVGNPGRIIKQYNPQTCEWERRKN